MVLSTPNGSTAKSLQGGGSIVNPQLNVILLTPLSVHSLSVVPVVLPGSSKVTIVKSDDNRDNAQVVLDNEMAFILDGGEGIEIRGSDFPMTFVQSTNNFDELWIKAVIDKMHYNVGDE